MPSTDAILDGLSAIANQWRAFAIAWHACAAIAIVALGAGWRPSNRLAGALLIPPLVSVSVLAWRTGNPFNGAMFAVLTVVLAAVAARVPPTVIRRSPPRIAAVGALLVAFAWGYPHFLLAQRWIEYAYAAPMGLLPCPTLSALIGVTLIAGLFGSRPWSLILALAGVVYGAIGVFRLGVALDVALLAGGLTLSAAAVLTMRRRRGIGGETVSTRLGASRG